MASGADDGNVHVFHTTVYADLTKNPLIVPVKVLSIPPSLGVGVLNLMWHPTQPVRCACTDRCLSRMELFFFFQAQC